MGGSESLKAAVRENYARAALRVGGHQGGCCGSSSDNSCGSTISANLYDTDEQANVPAEAMAASLGCGNPTALAELKPARLCSTWAPSGESTCCYRLDGSARLAKPTDST